VVHALHDHRFLYKQCKGLAEKGYDVDFLVQASEECVINKVTIKPLKSQTCRLKRFLSTFGLFPMLWNKYDVIDLVDPELLPLGLIIKLISKLGLGNVKVIFDAHEDYQEFMQHKHYLNAFFCKAFALSIKFVLNLSSVILDGFVFADEGTAREFSNLPERRKSIFHNFPMLSLFPKRQNAWSARKYDVAYLGTMSRTSGTFIMLEAITILKNKKPNLKCLFIGEPQSYIQAEIDGFIDKHGLANCVEFTGRLKHADVPQVLQQCKVGLIGLMNLPKFQKNIATKMFEYMASAIPVVSSDLLPERNFMSHGKHGFFVEPENPYAMAVAVYKIISDEQLGQKMSNSCREHLLKRGYYAENELDKLAEFYNYILKQPRSRLCGS